ncbi:membrane transport family protein [Orientia chuto str. Dubai]|uniref:Membrane transport family protein n=1 Tax=Orientia chuto str. Dubai TaxID=1359168 RepID=A0A0F3ML20_9RICK|nr:AEC family transporter [Candidatus Orientia mediorientalis]KJV56346.1 membrane transport family protein [Orientia chuto str. Dubai]
MAIFYFVFFKIIAILLNVVIGFLAGKWSKVERDSIAGLLFYFIAPIVFFSIPAHTKLNFHEISIAIVTFTIASILCGFSNYVFKKYWHDPTHNILAMAAGTANTGYFMLPIAAKLLDEHTLSLYMMAIIGVSIYESSIGFYICVKSLKNTRESIIQVLKFPNLNAFILGCIFSLTGLTLPKFLDSFIEDMIKSYSVLGMIIVGLSVSKLVKFTIDSKFTLAAFISKFVFYPLAINIFILLDKITFSIYTISHYNALKLLSIAPMATNIIVISSIIKFQPERSAATVLLSCIFALFYIPLMIALTLQL